MRCPRASVCAFASLPAVGLLLTLTPFAASLLPRATTPLSQLGNGPALPIAPAAPAFAAGLAGGPSRLQPVVVSARASIPSREGLRIISQRGALTLRAGWLNGARTYVVDVPLNAGVRLSVGLAEGGIGSDEPFGRLVDRYAAAAAITGTFFGVNNLLPTGDIVVAGRCAYLGFVGTALTASADGDVRLQSVARGRCGSWGGYETVLRGGPRLLKNGQWAGRVAAQGFRRVSEDARRPRTAIGLAGDRLMLIAVPDKVTMAGLAGICKRAGARDAVAMDGGSSTALAFDGSPVVRPGRRLTNALLVYDDSRDYAEAEPLLLAALPSRAFSGSEARVGAFASEVSGAAPVVVKRLPGAPRIDLEILATNPNPPAVQ